MRDMSHDKREFSSWWTETNQKQRTRQALVAAKALVANGRPVTIADVAEAAQVSVATAYRYFSNRTTSCSRQPLRASRCE
jgi:AcrR family transcriptional regulator